MMDPKDQIHTSFRAPKAIYSYNVMPFELKNAGVTYQRLINKVLKDHIRWNVETYVDDMVVKTIHGGSHIEDLWDVFNTLSKY